MKKIIVLGIAAATLCACNVSEPVKLAPRAGIGFSSFVDKSTKATDVTTTSNFSASLYGWVGDSQLWTSPEALTVNNGTCSYTNTRYWMPSQTYVFEAVSPQNGSNGVSYTASKGGSTLSFTNDGDTDLIYAPQVTRTTDATISTQPTAVELTFQHLLSRVKFTFVNGFPTTGNPTITVSNVKIIDAVEKASISLGDSNAMSTATWGSASETLKLSFAASTTNALTNIAAGDKTGDTEHHYLIPMTDNYTVTFTATLTQGGVSTNFLKTVTVSNLTLEKGKSYNLKAELDENNLSGLYPITFTATVSEWAAFGDKTVTVQ